MQPKCYFYFRTLWALIFLGHLCADVLQTAYDGEIQLYLVTVSRWTLLVQVADNMLQLYCAAIGLTALPNEKKEFVEVPEAVSAAVALAAVSQPLSFLVVVWYWGFNHTWGQEETPSYLGLFLHLISWLLQLLSLAVSRVPLSISHGGWLVAFVVSFLVWSYAHYALRIGTPGGCKNYVQPECPMYSALDWHMPQVAAFTALISIVATPVVVFLYAVIAKARGLATFRSDLQEMDETQRIEREARQARELEALKAAMDEEQQGYCFCRCR